MLRALILAMTILVLPLGSAVANAGPDSGGNAALQYWQAFATLPRFTDAENKKIRDPLTTPVDADLRKILTKAEYSLQMLHRGAAVRRCDWGISYQDGVYTLLPHADAARVLTSLACLRGRLRFEAGQNAEAIDDLLAAMTLSRHASLDRSLLTVLVGFQIEHRMSEAIARYLPKLDAKTIKDLNIRLDALPPSGKLADGLMTCEKETMDWFIRKVRGTKDKESLLAFLSFVGISEGQNRDLDEKARVFLQECGGTAEGVVKFAEKALPSYSVMAKMMDLPLDEFEKEFKSESIKQAGNPVFKVFFPALGKLRQSKARADVRRTMLLAAIAVQLDGQDALKNHPDPVVGGRFEYVPFQGGFELRSKLTGQGDKSVKLSVGHRK
jgi:hypothetical protein